MPKRSPFARLLARWTARRYLGRPDQEEIILIKYPRFGDLSAAFLNELFFRLHWTRAYKLTSLNVELTSRCNLECTICPRAAAKGRGETDLDFETFKRIVDATPDLRVLLPFQWGEPLLSPILIPAVSYAAGKGIRVFLTTNGTLLDEKASRGLIRAGLERLTVSFDGSPATFEAIRGVRAGLVMGNIEGFKKIRDEAKSSCALDISMVVDEETEGEMDAFRETFAGLADRIQFIPRFSAAPRRRPCRELWRGVLVVLANGDVTVCCADPSGRAVLGNIREKMPVEWFNSLKMRAFRGRHLRGDFPSPCRNCGEYATPRVSPRFS